mgnify:CR=1 FL=1
MYRKKLILLISLIGLFVGLIFVIRFYQIFFWSNTNFENDFAYIFIDRDDTIDSLNIKLKPIIKSNNFFLTAAEKKGYFKSIIPGKYKIKKRMGNNQIINILRSQKLTTKVVFNNQQRLEDLAGRIAAQIEPDSLELLNSFLDSSFLSKTGFSKENAMAMYLPNTYDVFWDTTPEDFRTRMLNYYNKFWNKIRLKKAKALNLSPIEVYILASIVQKESVKKDEQSRIAGVYINRLKRKIKLQADPTIIFALKLNSGDFNKVIKRVLYEDLRLKSEYNTYLKLGLPPGPIIMPDISTIDSVLNPEQHNFLYFVASPQKPGYHLFAENLKDHNVNKQYYIKWLDSKKLFR